MDSVCITFARASKKPNSKAAIASTLVGVTTYIISYQFKITILGINSVVWGILFGGIAYFLVGSMTCKEGLDPEVLKKCF